MMSDDVPTACGDVASANLFVLVVPIGGEDVNVDFLFKDSIYQPVLLGDLAGPSVFGFPFERLRVSPCLSWGGWQSR